jgi:hypothetical protein
MFPMYHKNLICSIKISLLSWNAIRKFDKLCLIKLRKYGGILMNITLDIIQDKIEFFEATDIKTLEKKINEQIEHNKAILLEVHHVSHQMHIGENGERFYSAVVHFKAKN